MSYDDPSQLGYFIKIPLWKSAIELLNYQLKTKKKNRHFNSVSMFYYERLGAKIDLLNDKDYFEDKIASNLFYALEQEFAVLPYPIPKGALGLRNYKFFTYPMRVLYYTFGLYLLQLSQEFIMEYAHRSEHIKLSYGGHLQFENDRLNLSRNSIYYYQHYKRFRNQVRGTLKDEDSWENKLVIKLDVQNYYDEISVPRLLEFLAGGIKPSIQKSLNYDAFAREQIVSFFNLLSRGDFGIPQADNDITSNFIGYLFMLFGALLLDDEVRQELNIIQEHLVIGYVDDIYISITFLKNVERSPRKACIDGLMSRIADVLYNELGLRLNAKSHIYWLDDEKDRKELINSLKKVSPGYYLQDDKQVTPEQQLESIFNSVGNLKKSTLRSSIDYDKTVEEEILKGVFDRRVAQMLDKPENRLRIKELFIDFNFDLVKARPREIIILLLRDAQTTEAFRRYLFAENFLTTREVDLILNFLCQTDFNDDELLNRLRQNKSAERMVGLFLKPDLATDLPGYFDLIPDQISKLLGIPGAIEQIRLRILQEKSSAFSVALNHLTNEIHTICWCTDMPNKQDYTAIDVDNFLRSQKISHKLCIKVRNLFNRRNTNQVSHPSSVISDVWGVDKEEYDGYRSAVGDCLKIIL